jgi:hypothetical protein
MNLNDYLLHKRLENNLLLGCKEMTPWEVLKFEYEYKHYMLEYIYNSRDKMHIERFDLCPYLQKLIL